ncbi:MAG: hypothetical protein WCX95_00585 [Candidatus Gracilibacteria bacterium]
MSKNTFKGFNDLVFQIAHQFYTWKYLQKSENSQAYNMRSAFWITTITTLQSSYLLNLANIFDENDARVLSVYTFIDELMDNSKKASLLSKIKNNKCENILKKLMQWRNNYLAHKNKYFTLNPSELTTKFPFKYGEIETVLSLLSEILEETKWEFDPKNATDYKKYYEEVECRCIEHTKFVLNYGLHTQGYKKAMTGRLIKLLKTKLK